LPLVSDQTIVQQLNFSAAYRWADYSGVGSVDSWKGGLDWTVNDVLRLRTTVSQDVRAATMGEKFDRTGGIANITDYLLDPGGGFSYGITTFSNGTPDIRPENAKTKVLGFVYTPANAEGLSLSVDWYNVKVTDNINQVTAADVVRGCHVDNDVDLCAFITRGGPPSTQNPAINTISLVGVPYYNQASVEANGVDFEVVYLKGVNWFGGGDVNMRLLGSYLSERSNTTSQGAKTEVQGRFGFPEWTAVISGGYRRGPLSVNLTARYTDDQLINPAWNFNGTSTRWDVADNTVDSNVLVDTSIRYRFGMGDGNMSVFGTINNLFDEDPEEFLALPFSSNFNTGTGLGVTGDQRGRRYVVGVSVDF
jgi:outer membrane receptor protein involved in Fe transport